MNRFEKLFVIFIFSVVFGLSLGSLILKLYLWNQVNQLHTVFVDQCIENVNNQVFCDCLFTEIAADRSALQITAITKQVFEEKEISKSVESAIYQCSMLYQV